MVARVSRSVGIGEANTSDARGARRKSLENICALRETVHPEERPRFADGLYTPCKLERMSFRLAQTVREEL